MVALSKRSQEAEAAFLSVYKQLIEAPGKTHVGSQPESFMPRKGLEACFTGGPLWSTTHTAGTAPVFFHRAVAEPWAAFPVVEYYSAMEKV